VHDLAEFADLEPVSLASAWISARIAFTLSLSLEMRFFHPFAESFEARLSQRGSSSEPK
jgi:hypothetical protein